MQSLNEKITLKDIIKNTTPNGWLLLLNPIIYLVFSRQRDLNDYSAIDTSAIIFILYSLVAFIMGIKVIYRTNSEFGKDIIKSSPIVVFIIYTVLCFVSALWSVNFKLTAYRAFECLAMTLLIVSVIQQLFETGDCRYVIYWSLFLCTWYVLWDILRSFQWATNIWEIFQASQMFATTFFFMALYTTPWRWYNWLIFVMSIFSMSTVAYIGMAIGSISAFFNKGKTKFIALAGAFILLIAVLAVGPYTILKDTVFNDKESISINETSGRDYLLEITLKTLEENPWGQGFFAAEPYVLYKAHFGAISAHNSLSSAAMGMGYPGIAIFAIFLIAMWVVTFSKYIDSRFRAILIGCMCVAFLHCIGNPSVGTRVYGAWIPGMYIFVLTCGFYIFGKYYENKESDEPSDLNICSD